MQTITKLGLADHDRAMTLDEFMEGDYEEGHRYELIEGRLKVSPLPGVPHDILERWIVAKVSEYALENPRVLNYVTRKARVFVPGATEPSAPEPDMGGYRDFPLEEDWDTLRWDQVQPILLGEVISPDDPEKDTVRNVRLYRRIRELREYWILDPTPRSDQPTITVHRRVGRRWEELTIPFGETYTTPFLPGFSLVIDPRRP